MCCLLATAITACGTDGDNINSATSGTDKPSATASASPEATTDAGTNAGTDANIKATAEATIEPTSEATATDNADDANTKSRSNPVLDDVEEGIGNTVDTLTTAGPR